MAHPALTDATIKSPVRLLADAVRVFLDASPSDAVPGTPAGRLSVERAYVPEIPIENIQGTMITVLPGAMSSEPGTRQKSRKTEAVEVFVERHLTEIPASAAGKAEIDAFLDFVERVCVALRSTQTVTDAESNAHKYLRHEQTDLEDDRLMLGQAAIRIDAEYEVWI